MSEPILISCPVDDLHPDPAQPRQHFDEEELKALSQSIASKGVLLPILVRRRRSKLEIVAGERRWRASKMAGLTHVPVIIRDFDDTSAFEVAVIENAQRSNLNPIEEALALRRLRDEHQYPPSQIADLIGKSAPYVSNSFRLLTLSDEHQRLVISGDLTARQARICLTIDDGPLRNELVSLMLKGMGTLDAEAWVRQAKKGAKEKKHKENRLAGESPYKSLFDLISRKLGERFGAEVSVAPTGRSGHINFKYSNLHELALLTGRLLEKK